MTISIPVLRIDSGIEMPSYAHEGDAGLDIRSAIDITLLPFQRALIPTGIAVAIPDGYAGFMQPRSGIALKQGLSMVNTPGLIDAHYRGELKIAAINLDPCTPIEISRGDKIAQLVVQAVECVNLLEVEILDETVRGQGGFGSTGVS